jgi:hypothetical protein
VAPLSPVTRRGTGSWMSPATITLASDIVECCLKAGLPFSRPLVSFPAQQGLTDLVVSRDPTRAGGDLPRTGLATVGMWPNRDRRAACRAGCRLMQSRSSRDVGDPATEEPQRASQQVRSTGQIQLHRCVRQVHGLAGGGQLPCCRPSAAAARRCVRSSPAFMVEVAIGSSSAAAHPGHQAMDRDPARLRERRVAAPKGDPRPRRL